MKKIVQALFGFWIVSYSLMGLAAPRVVVTIKPIYGLVASIMQGVGTPELILPDYASPHTFQLKPSNYQQLYQADLIIWVGPDLEAFLIGPLEKLTPKFGLLTLENQPGIITLAPRHGRNWQETDSDHDHAHESIDPHIWLSINNAQTIVKIVAEVLSKADPEHATQYKHNAVILQNKLARLKLTLEIDLLPVRTQPFLVYHDGYQYFEKEFGLNGAGTMIINPQLPLSAKGLQEIGQMIESKKIRCVFRETEFHENLVRNSLQQWPVKVVELDPLGAKQTKGPEVYETTLLELGKQMKACLSPSSS